MRKALKIGIPVVVALLAIGGFAGWWFFVRDDSPPAVAGVAEHFDATTAAAGAATTAAPADGPTTADGTWMVRPTPQVFAGYRIDEELVGGAVTSTAVGRSPAVSGSLTIEGATVSAAQIEVDLTQLESDSNQRDSQLRRGGLATDEFPTATFVLTAPLDLGAEPEPGQVFDVVATGDLTLHGATNPVSWPLQARWTGTTVDVTGSTEIVLADYGISMEAFVGFVKVAPRGTIELALQFERQ